LTFRSGNDITQFHNSDWL